jgi:hypothetical protein
MPLNISRGLRKQVEDRKHALVRWATEQGKLEDSAYLDKVNFLDNLIRTFGGNPDLTAPSEDAINISRINADKKSVIKIKK